MIIQTCGPEPEPEAFVKACTIVATRWPGYNATIFTAERTADGWLEYGVQVRDSEKPVFFVALIQRTVGAEWESHS